MNSCETQRWKPTVGCETAVLWHVTKEHPLPVAGFLQGTDNWIQTRPNPRDSRKDSIRVDYYLSQKTRLNFSGTHFTYHEDDPFAPTGPLDRSNSRWDRPNMTGMIGLTS